MHTIREITRLATMLAGLVATLLRLGFVSASSRLCHSYVSATPWLRIGYTSTTPHLRFDYAVASISCEHCRSSRNNSLFASRYVIYYCLTSTNSWLWQWRHSVNGEPLHCFQWQVYHVFITFFAKNENYCIHSYTFLFKFDHRIIISMT